jgi:ribosomal protein L32E
VPESVRAQLPPGYLPVSVKSGQNVEALRGEIDRMLIDLAAILQQRAREENANAAATAATAAAAAAAGAANAVAGDGVDAPTR